MAGNKTYWISFKIEDDAGYQRRYDALESCISKLAGEPGTWWRDTTSFLFFWCEQGIDHIAAAVKDAIDPEVDIAVIGMTDFKTARIMGAYEDDDIFRLVPFMKYA